MRKSLIFKLISTSLALLLMASCSFLEFPGVYRLDIPQGNLVDSENVEQVQIGMEPRQVRYLLGTPLVTDTFNQNRWDYFYSVNKQGEQTVEHHLSILFDQGRVIDIKDKLKDQQATQ
ncbi:MAG: outer membrane protein assembly factor BamE [Cellvibrionaceae bacterium]